MVEAASGEPVRPIESNEITAGRTRPPAARAWTWSATNRPRLVSSTAGNQLATTTTCVGIEGDMRQVYGATSPRPAGAARGRSGGVERSPDPSTRAREPERLDAIVRAMGTTQELRASLGRTRRGPLELIREGFTDIWSRRRLARYLVQADLVKKGSDTILGNIWWVLDPLLQMAMYVVFVTIITSHVQPPAALYLLRHPPLEVVRERRRNAVAAVTSQARIVEQVQFPSWSCRSLRT